jgi:hydrogenase maturation protease
VLVLGYGNPGRFDDGLGPAFVEAVAALGIDGVTVESDYQLQPEAALLVAEHDVVVFVDAAAEGPEPFSFAAVAPSVESSFTTHHLSAEGLLALARDALGARTRAYVLAIRGREFGGFGESLSAAARENLAAALAFLRPRLTSGAFDDATATNEG